MKSVVGNLHTGRKDQADGMIQRHSQLHFAPWKGVPGDLKGPELNTESDYQVRSMTTPTGTGDFPFPQGSQDH